ncbi:penicillin-binding transpeptidase domain-containing protein, partial [Streptomyces sp. NPDC004980]
TSSPSAIRMAGSYATFATSGKQRDPFSVTEVKKKGSVVYQHKTVTKTAMEKVIADNVTDVLKNVVENGTGTPARLDGRDAAGKTGTTDGNKSAWFVGYTPQLSTAVSMFRLDDDEKQKNREFLEMYGTGGEKQIHGASFPAQIWHDYMTDAMKGEKVVKFPTPEPFGEVVGTPSPTPSPSASPSPSESSEAPTTPSPSPSSASPSPSGTCGAFGWECQNNGGTNTGTDSGGTDAGTTDGGTDAGTTDGGTDTGTTDGTTDGSTGNTNGNGNGNSNGGLFGGSG